MKHLKTHENWDDDSKFKVGDYVTSLDSNRKGVIDQVSYYNHTFIYIIKGYINIWDVEASLNLMTPEEIEQYEIEIESEKYNL